MSRIRLDQAQFRAALTLYRQWGALIGAGGFFVVTLLIWQIASIGLPAWLLAEVVCAALGAVIGSVVFSQHYEERTTR